MPDIDPRAIEIQQLPGHFFGMWLCYMIDVKADKNCDFSNEMQLDWFPHFFPISRGNPLFPQEFQRYRQRAHS